MNKVIALAALFVASIIAPMCRAEDVKPDLREQVRKASIALYAGEQVCKWSKIEGNFFGLPVYQWEWGCQFVSRPICTATVINQIDEHTYVGLTAGYCFERPLDATFDYYVADDLADEPVLRKINLVKRDNSKRYDFAIFEFHSLRDYPTIPVDLSAKPELGRRVICVNFGMGAVKATLEGAIVSGYIPTHDDDMSEGRYLVSIGVGPGASGSAIVDEESGKIVALTEGIFPGTQMSTVVIETGDRLLNFMDDDSAGLEQKPPVGQAPHDPALDPKPEPSSLELIQKLLSNTWQWIVDDISNNN